MMKKKIFIYSFYRFKKIKKINYIKKFLKKLSDEKVIYGTVLIAEEGINGTISGDKNYLDEFIYELKRLIGIRKLSVKISKNQFIPFYRLKIRLKREIVTIGNKSISPIKLSGKSILPKDWDKIINNKNYTVIDTRNDYEIKIGTFKNSVNPKIKTFREFTKYINNLEIVKSQPIAMFCTGGIRCEKASSYLLKKGYQNVSQLDGGILNYLEFKKNKKDTSWEGECFVFDNRVSVNKKLQKGIYDQCFGCRHPITESEKLLKSYVKGVSCKYCYKNKTKEKILRSSTRQKQINFAELQKKDHPFKKIYESDLS